MPVVIYKYQRISAVSTELLGLSANAKSQLNEKHDTRNLQKNVSVWLSMVCGPKIPYLAA